MSFVLDQHDADDHSMHGIRLAPGVVLARSAVRFAFSRSGGPGGQNVNKLATRAELRIALSDLPIAPDARHRLVAAAGRKVTDAGELQIVCESERSQERNKAECIDRLREMVLAALVRPKTRRTTKPSRGSKERRLEGKKVRAEIKRGRGRGGAEE